MRGWLETDASPPDVGAYKPDRSPPQARQHNRIRNLQLLRYHSGMKRTLLTMLTALTVLALPSQADEVAWHTDLPKALATAKAENKKVLVNFTGSDWCGFCIKLQKEVFTKPEFQEYAKKNLVLVEADFPHNKKLPAEVKAANEKLKKEHQVKGYPTLVLLDSKGATLGKMVGYGGGGWTKVLAELESTKSK